MDTSESDSTSIPTATEAPSMLEYATPKPLVSVWQLGEICCRYFFAAAVATLGIMLFQVIVAALLSGLPRPMQGEAIAIPFWLFISLVIVIPLLIAAAFSRKLSRHKIGLSLLLSWELLMSVLFAFANSNGFYKAWNRGW